MNAKSNPIAWFIGVTVLWSWGWWIPGVMWFTANQPTELPPFLFVLAIIGAFGPSVSAVIVTRLRGESIRDLLSKFTLWRHDWRWYAYLLVPLVLLGVAMLAYHLVAGPLTFSNVGRVILLAPLVYLTALPFGPLGEELGWRGFLLPHLEKHQSAVVSSLMVGFIWAMWHIPLFWVPGAALPAVRPVSIGAVSLYTLNLMAMSVLYTYLMHRTKGSVLMAVLFHAAVNSAGGILIPLLGADVVPEVILTINAINTGLIVVVAIGLGFLLERESV